MEYHLMYCIFGYFQTLLTTIHVWNVLSPKKVPRLSVLKIHTYWIYIYLNKKHNILWKSDQPICGSLLDLHLLFLVKDQKGDKIKKKYAKVYCITIWKALEKLFNFPSLIYSFDFSSRNNKLSIYTLEIHSRFEIVDLMKKFCLLSKKKEKLFYLFAHF